jgi:hypothetical protein
VGAPRADDADGNASGSAYLFDFSDPCNIIETKLTASDAAEWDLFGRSVAISSSTALVGAGGDDDACPGNPGCNSGSAYLFCLFPPFGDINLDCRVDFRDLAVLCEEWLLEELSWDVWPNDGDGFVNFLDWALFADEWGVTVDIERLVDFAEQWLKSGSNYVITDIAPGSDGDGITNGVDFAALADNWLAGI